MLAEKICGKKCELHVLRTTCFVTHAGFKKNLDFRQAFFLLNNTVGKNLDKFSDIQVFFVSAAFGEGRKSIFYSRI